MEAAASSAALHAQRRSVLARLRLVRAALVAAESEQNELTHELSVVGGGFDGSISELTACTLAERTKRMSAAGDILDACGAAMHSTRQAPPALEANALLSAIAGMPACSPMLRADVASTSGAAQDAAPRPLSTAKPPSPLSSAQAAMPISSARFRKRPPARLSIPEGQPSDGSCKSSGVTIPSAHMPTLTTLAEGGLCLEAYENPYRELPLSAKSHHSIESFSSC